MRTRSDRSWLAIAEALGTFEGAFANIRNAFGPVLVAAVRRFSHDGAIKMAAAVAYYAILSAGPLLVVLLAIADTIWGREAAMEQLMSQFRVYLGDAGVAALRRAVVHSRIPGEIGIAAATSGLVLLLSATLLFSQLRDSLTKIWDLPRPEGAVRAFFRQRILALVTILFVGVLLLLSTIASSLLAVFRAWVGGSLPGPVQLGVDWLIWLLWFALLVATLFRALSARQIPWRNVWVGAFTTSLLFLVGKELIAIYLAKATVASAYGAAGALATISMWVYFSSMALFFGAEYARAWADSRVERSARA